MLARNTGWATCPQGLRNDGSFRRIVVKIRGRNYTVRTRSGYCDLRFERTDTAKQGQ